MGFSKKRAERRARATEAKFEKELFDYAKSLGPLGPDDETFESLIADGFDENDARCTLLQLARYDFEQRAVAYLNDLLGDGNAVYGHYWNTETFFCLDCHVKSGCGYTRTAHLTTALNEFAADTPFVVHVSALRDTGPAKRYAFEVEAVRYLEKLLGKEGYLVDYGWNTDTRLWVDCHLSKAAVKEEEHDEVAAWLNKELNRYATCLLYTSPSPRD